MNIWRIVEPRDSKLAMIDIRGTYVEGTGWKGPCKVCRSGVCRELVAPLLIRWDPDSDVIGDFAWQGDGMGPVITERVATTLAERFQGFELGVVEMEQDPTLKRPARITKRTRRRVWLPYEGPPLSYLDVSKFVHMDRERTTATVRRHCTACGRKDWQLTGVEWHSIHYDKALKHSVPDITRRAPGQGLFVHASDLKGAHFFRVHELYDNLSFCVDAVKDFIEAQGYTNVEFWEFGNVIE